MCYNFNIMSKNSVRNLCVCTWLMVTNNSTLRPQSYANMQNNLGIVFSYRPSDYHLNKHSVIAEATSSIWKHSHYSKNGWKNMKMIHGLILRQRLIGMFNIPFFISSAVTYALPQPGTRREGVCVWSWVVGGC